MMARRRGWGWISIRTTRENKASAQDRRIRFHPKCNLHSLHCQHPMRRGLIPEVDLMPRMG